MVDRDLIESQPAHIRVLITQAFVSLAASGIFEAQINRNANNLVRGFTTTNPEVLAKAIVEKQSVNRALMQMIELGNSLK